MDLENIKKAEVKNKRVILRVDFNVPMQDGAVTDGFRIEKTIPTITYLLREKAIVILISHLTSELSWGLLPVAEYLKKYFPNLVYVPGNSLEKAKSILSKLSPGAVIMLDNIRLFNGEEENNENFSAELASLGDVYVNEAFSVSHRVHASIVGLPKALPSYTGFLFEEEYRNLREAFNPSHPFLLILGGIKFKSKLGVLARFINIADTIFIGGGLANNFFKALGQDIGNSVVDDDVDIRPYLGNSKIVIPVDVEKKGDQILDMGPQSIALLSELIRKAAFIIWNGPFGNYEAPGGFDFGTKEIAKKISSARGKVLIGGGNTLDVLRHMEGWTPKAGSTFLSTAGGAMLEFLAEGTLPGIEALKRLSP